MAFTIFGAVGFLAAFVWFLIRLLIIDPIRWLLWGHYRNLACDYDRAAKAEKENNNLEKAQEYSDLYWKYYRRASRFM